MELKMTIIGETLRKYRESRNFPQAELAARSKVSKRTISRIESGLIKRPNKATLEKLAKALDIKIADLAKQAGDREAVEHRLKKDGYRKLNTFIDGETSVAYAMVQHVYSVSPKTLIEMAPLFFTLLAEGSVAWRKRKADELSATLKALGSIPSDAPHLAYAKAGYIANDALDDELKSIAERDIFGEKISEEAFNFGYNSSGDNPFVSYMHSLGNDIDASSLEIDPLALGNLKADDCMPHYLIAPADLKTLTGGDIWAEFAIEHGHVRISEIPVNLMGRERKAERVYWISSKIPDEARKEHQDWLDSLLEMDLGSLDLGKSEESND
jgi:transcriptional regulator with XRE-family HTH domain